MNSTNRYHSATWPAASHGCVEYVGSTLSDIASPQQSLQLIDVQAVTADDGAVEEEDWDVEAMTALEDGVAVDVDNVDGR